MFQPCSKTFHNVESCRVSYLCRNYGEVCCIYSPVYNPLFARSGNSYSRYTCGRKDKYRENFDERISGDNDAAYGEFPWMVTMYMEEKNNNSTIVRYICGGSLIHPSVVITAAHCIKSKRRYVRRIIIRVGEGNSKIEDGDRYRVQERYIESLIIHPLYNVSQDHRNDIAIIFLRGEVFITDNVDVVCLPQQDQTFNSTRCLASGWGISQYNDFRKKSDYLKKINLPIVSKDQCQQGLRNALGETFQLNPSALCAGGVEDEDSCLGDGGGPLVCPIDEEEVQYVQVGIVSAGVGCGERDRPAVYTNVALFRDWIDKEVQSRGRDTSYYNSEDW